MVSADSLVTTDLIMCLPLSQPAMTITTSNDAGRATKVSNNATTFVVSSVNCLKFYLLETVGVVLKNNIRTLDFIPNYTTPN